MAISVYVLTIICVIIVYISQMQKQMAYNKAREDKLYETIKEVSTLLPNLSKQMQEIKDEFDSIKDTIERSNRLWQKKS